MAGFKLLRGSQDLRDPGRTGAARQEYHTGMLVRMTLLSCALLLGDPRSFDNLDGVVVHTADQRVLAGTLVAITEEGQVVLEDLTGERIALASAEVIEVRWIPEGADGPEAATRGEPSWPEGDDPDGWPRYAQSRDGTRLVGRCVSPDGVRLMVAHPVLGEFQTSRPYLHSIFAGPPPPQPLRESAPAGAPDRGLPATRATDEVHLVDGDVLSGLVTALDERAIMLEIAGDVVPVPWSRVDRLLFAEPEEGPEAIAPAPPEASGRSRHIAVVVELVDGSLWHAYVPLFDGCTFSWHIGDTYRGARVSIGGSWVRRIEFRSGSWQWLSELAPGTIRRGGMFGPARPPMRDLNVSGGPMRMAGRPDVRGIGVHAPTTVLYRLEGRYARLVGRVGIDDSAGPLARADARVVVDGRDVWRAEGLRYGDRPVPLDVPLRAGQVLELVVEPGAGGDVQDRVNWAGMVLFRGNGL